MRHGKRSKPLRSLLVGLLILAGLWTASAVELFGEGWGRYHDATIRSSCDFCTAGEAVTISGDGINLPNGREAYTPGWWLAYQPESSVAVEIAAEGTWSTVVVWPTPGVFEVYLYTIKNGGHFVSVAEVYVTVLAP